MASPSTSTASTTASSSAASSAVSSPGQLTFTSICHGPPSLSLLRIDDHTDSQTTLECERTACVSPSSNVTIEDSDQVRILSLVEQCLTILTQAEKIQREKGGDRKTEKANQLHAYIDFIKVEWIISTKKLTDSRAWFQHVATWLKTEDDSLESITQLIKVTETRSKFLNLFATIDRQLIEWMGRERLT